MFKVGQQIWDDRGALHTVKRVNKNGTIRVQFWNRNDVQVECTCRPEEFSEVKP